MSDVKSMIEAGKTSLGIEFGSTRIKAVLVGEDNAPIASGSHEWENRLDNGVWTYTLEDIWTGLQDCYRDLAVDVKKQYDVELTTVGALGFSAMMHGYMVFDKAGEQLVPFVTHPECSRSTAQHVTGIKRCLPSSMNWLHRKDILGK